MKRKAEGMKSCGQTWLAVLILLAALLARMLWPAGAAMLGAGVWLMLRQRGVAVLAAAIWRLLYQENGRGLVKRGEMI